MERGTLHPVHIKRTGRRYCQSDGFVDSAEAVRALKDLGFNGGLVEEFIRGLEGTKAVIKKCLTDGGAILNDGTFLTGDITELMEDSFIGRWLAQRGIAYTYSRHLRRIVQFEGSRNFGLFLVNPEVLGKVRIIQNPHRGVHYDLYSPEGSKMMSSLDDLVVGAMARRVETFYSDVRQIIVAQADIAKIALNDLVLENCSLTGN